MGANFEKISFKWVGVPAAAELMENKELHRSRVLQFMRPHFDNEKISR
jgi:hypothetical protein